MMSLRDLINSAMYVKIYRNFRNRNNFNNLCGDERATNDVDKLQHSPEYLGNYKTLLNKKREMIKAKNAFSPITSRFRQ